MSFSFDIFHRCCLAAVLLMSSCESTGQSDGVKTGTHLKGRTVPEHITENLPRQADTVLSTIHYRFLSYGEIDPSLIRSLAEKNESSLSELIRFTGTDKRIPVVTCHLYPSPEIKGLLLQNSKPCQIDFDAGEIHLIANDILKDHYLAEGHALYLRKTLGEPPVKILEPGLSVLFSDGWQRFGYSEWAGRLHMAGKIPSLKDLLDNELQPRCSDIIFFAASAAFVEFLVEQWGRPGFLKAYTTWQPTTDELLTIEPKWKNFLSEKAKAIIKTDRPDRLPYVKGFNFAHEGYRIYNGYGSRKAGNALERLTELGSNSVAIVPYSFIRDPHAPVIIPVVRRSGTENDESVIQSAEDAQKMNMTVIMKPQIWLGGSYWTGDIDMQTEAGWHRFFDCYGHWISHYAILSEIYDWEMLCIGNELVRSTLQREMAWRQLAGDIRHIYSGPLTYAANWGEEFENTGLWEVLDYIGLNCYYPLSDKDDPTDTELRRGFENVIRKIETVSRKYNKPVIFTEIGFPNIDAPWKQPHLDRGDFQPNPLHQKRCYEIVFEGIDDKAWCGGILWWKYPSDPDNRRRSTGFSPHGKPAEEVVARWFGEEQ